MAKKDLTFTSKILLSLLAAGAAADTLLKTPDRWMRHDFYCGREDYDSFRKIVYYLQNKGWIKMVDKNSQKFIRLTSEGQLEALLAKARLPVPGKWDGKWRMVIFDIPEDAKGKRSHLRMLLKKNKFYMLQASVYVNPYPLNREAVEYLQKTGLIGYIRIVKVEEMDNDRDLKKHFKLK